MTSLDESVCTSHVIASRTSRFVLKYYLFQNAEFKTDLRLHGEVRETWSYIGKQMTEAFRIETTTMVKGEVLNSRELIKPTTKRVIAKDKLKFEETKKNFWIQTKNMVEYSEHDHIANRSN